VKYSFYKMPAFKKH